MLSKPIYNLKPFSISFSEIYGETIVHVKYKNKHYVGEAKLHPEDKGLYNKTIGYNIAMSKIYIQILKDEANRAKQEYYAKLNYYKEVTRYLKDSIEADPTCRFFKNLKLTYKRWKNYQKLVNYEEKLLRHYFKFVNKGK